MKLHTLAIITLMASGSAALADGSHAHADDWEAGRPGMAQDVTRVIEIDMLEPDSGGMAFSPEDLQVVRGETIRFVVRNLGYLDHEFVIDTVEANMEHSNVMMMNPDMQHSDPNAITLAPDATGELIWTFSQAGTFQFACLIPGHMEAGMHGPISVN
ncbi:cupredoxin domain-containing protein [Pararhodobacter marinus]|uniref:cupredoxin domain-containing protein n=1 Tax=Pararhodobacter marinus TaxID=2184063 RepID=UPI003512CB34